MKKVLSLLVALALLLTLVACQPKEMVLNWNIGADPATIDPTLNGASDGGDVINQTFEGLVREINGEVFPGIAQSWTVAPDGLTVTFNLRQSKWSDGSNLTASDFVYSFKRGMDLRTASEYSWIWEYTNIVGSMDAIYFTDDNADGKDDVLDKTIDELLAVVGVEALDNYTLKISLTHPTAYFVSLMAFYHFMPVKQSSVEHADGADGLWAKTPALAVCNGPFKLTAYTIGAGLTLEKNEHYWNADEVRLTKIEGKFLDDDTTAYAGYQAGTLDVIPTVPSSEVARLIAEDPEFYVFPLLGTYYYSFNMNDPQNRWANQKLRKALNFAVNREAIVDALGAGQVPAVGFVPPGFRDHLGRDFFETAGAYGMVSDGGNFAQAVTLFADAAAELSMTVAELRLFVKDSVILYNTSSGHQLVAQMVQESWNQVLGIQFQLQNQDWATFQDTRKNGNFDIARGGWLTDFMDPAGLLAIFVQGNAYNDPKFSNAQYNQLLADAQSTTSAQVHFEKLYAAQTILMTELPIIPIYHYSDIIMVKSYVKGWGRSVLGSVDFSGAYLDK
jgi:oligopeptide transport system substrate-binding protein